MRRFRHSLTPILIAVALTVPADVARKAGGAAGSHGRPRRRRHGPLGEAGRQLLRVRQRHLAQADRDPGRPQHLWRQRHPDRAPRPRPVISGPRSRPPAARPPRTRASRSARRTTSTAARSGWPSVGPAGWRGSSWPPWTLHRHDRPSADSVYVPPSGQNGRAPYTRATARAVRRGRPAGFRSFHPRLTFASMSRFAWHAARFASAHPRLYPGSTSFQFSGRTPQHRVRRLRSPPASSPPRGPPRGPPG